MVKRHINYQLTIFNLCADKGINVIKKIRNNYSLQCGERKEFKCTPSFTSVTLEKLRLRTNSILIIFSVPFRLNKQSKEKIKSSPQKFSVVSYRSEEFNSSTSRDHLVLHTYICTYSTYSHRCIYIYMYMHVFIQHVSGLRYLGEFHWLLTVAQEPDFRIFSPSVYSLCPYSA